MVYGKRRAPGWERAFLWDCLRGLFALFELLLEGGEGFEVAESGLLGCGKRSGFFSLTGSARSASGFAFGFAFGLGFVFVDAAVAEDDAAVVLVEFDYLEFEGFAGLGLSAVFFDEVAGSCESFNAFGEGYDSTFFHEFGDGALVNGAYAVLFFKGVPGVVFELLVTEAEATVFLVDFEDLNFDGRTDLSEFAGVFDLLGPREVRDVDQAVNSFFEFYEYAEVSEVANLGGVAAADGEAHFDVGPGIGFDRIIVSGRSLL